MQTQCSKSGVGGSCLVVWWFLFWCSCTVCLMAAVQKVFIVGVRGLRAPVVEPALKEVLDRGQRESIDLLSSPHHPLRGRFVRQKDVSSWISRCIHKYLVFLQDVNAFGPSLLASYVLYINHRLCRLSIFANWKQIHLTNTYKYISRLISTLKDHILNYSSCLTCYETPGQK